MKIKRLDSYKLMLITLKKAGYHVVEVAKEKKKTIITVQNSYLNHQKIKANANKEEK
jgi:hypothetical protein